MIELGTVKPGSTIRIPFSTFDKDDGSSITMTDYAEADILIYKDGNVTERASTSGFTATTNFDTKTGKHLAVINLADNTTANFFSAGSEYLVAIDAVTVDGVTTGGWIGRFRIGYPGAALDTTITVTSQTQFTLAVGPAEDDALNGMTCILHDIASAVQWSKALVLDYVGSTKTVTLAAAPTFTIATGDNFSIVSVEPIVDQARTTQALIEHQRGGHTHQPIGRIIFVSPNNGDTHANGARGGINDPYSLVQDAHDNAVTDSNHDLIILLSDGTGGPTTLTENVTLSKRYLFIRGPGRDFIWTRSGAGDTITVTADGIELSGFQLQTAATGSGAGINATSVDFLSIHHVWVNATQGNGITLTDCDNAKVMHNHFQDTGAGGSGHGLVLDADTGQTGQDINIISNTFHGVEGDAIRLNPTGTGTIQEAVIHDNVIGNSTGYGINLVAANVTLAIITNNRLANNTSGAINDNGTNTHAANNEQWALAGDAMDLVANAVDTTSIANDAITAAKIANGAIDAATFAAGAITATVIATDAIDADAIADNAIDANSIAASALNGKGDWATAANVNEQVSDVLKVDTITLPGQTAPPATPTFEQALSWLFKSFRNKKEQTSSEWRLYDDAGSTVDSKATVSDNGTTATKEEIVTGP